MQELEPRSVMTSRRSSLKRFRQGARPRLRLVCFPWCGAGASVYRRLASSLPEHIDVLAVQLPGREEQFGVPCLRRMEQVIDHVIDDIAANLDMPLVLFGHSLGALMAHETAWALKTRLGREPHGLVVSGHEAPRRGATRSRWHDAALDVFIANLRRLGGTPEEVLADGELMRTLLPIVRADYEILETYEPGMLPAMSCPMLACAGMSDSECSPESLRDWELYTTGSFEARVFAGDHFYLGTDAKAVARGLEDWIAALLPAPNGELP